MGKLLPFKPRQVDNTDQLEAILNVTRMVQDAKAGVKPSAPKDPKEEKNEG